MNILDECEKKQYVEKVDISMVAVYEMHFRIHIVNNFIISLIVVVVPSAAQRVRSLMLMRCR